MRIVSAEDVEAALDFKSLVERLREAFQRDVTVPLRHHHQIAGAEGETTLLLMPAWQADRHIGVKMVTICPENGARGLPAVMGVYMLLDGRTGAPLALLDGPVLTARRTAAASALASTYLSRPEAERLLMVGTGTLAPHLIGAHAAVRPIREVQVWGRTPEKAKALAKRLDRPDLRVTATTDLEAAARAAHVISCATITLEPLIEGAWLQPGQHLDLVGGFRPDMRETDDTAIGRATVFVDTHAGATAEAGDIVQPIANGVLKAEDIGGDLFDLARGRRSGRRDAQQITIFKSVGTALEDLAAAELAVERV